MSQNPSLQQNAQFYPPQQQFFYQQTEQRYAQLPMHPNQGAIYMQPMAAPAIGPPHQQMHSIHQDYQQHQSTHPGPNYAPHPHPPQQLLTSMAAHGGQQIANLVPFNMMGMDGPPPMVSAPAHQQQPQHFHSHQQQPHLPPQSAPYHNQSSNFVPASKPKVNPSIPFYGGNHVDMKGNGPHQQMHPFHQDYQQHQSTYPGANFLPHAHPPPSLLAPHGGQQITGIVSQFGMMSMNMDTPPPMVPAPAHQQQPQHFYSHQQQHHMPPQSAPPSHNPFIPTSKAKGRSMSIQPPADGLQQAENTGAEEDGGGNNVDGKEGNEVLENERNDGGGQQTPVDGRNSSTTDAQQTKTTPSSMETKEENKHRTLSGEGDKNKPIKMDQWQPSKDQPAASISPNNTVGGGHGHGTPPDSGSAMVTMTTNSAAINVPGRPPSSHQYQQQNSQLQSRRTSQDNRQEGRGQEGGRIYNNSAYITSGRGDHGKYHQNRPSGHGHYNFNYKPNTGGGGGPQNMFSGNNPSNPSSHHQPQQYHHNYHQNNQSSFYGTRSDVVRTNQCPACNNSGHRLMLCPETKVEREELHKFARQFEKQAHHPALQEPKEMTSSNRAPYHQRHSQEGGRGGGGGDYHHHHYNPQQQNNQHKRFGSGGGGGGGGGNRYSNNNAFGGGRDGGGGIRASKGGGGGNYRPNAQQQQQQ